MPSYLRHLLPEDILHEQRRVLDNPEVNLTNDDLENRCLQKIDHFIKGCGRSFLDFPTIPMPVYNEEEVDQNNRLICDKMRYNRRALAVEHQQLVGNLIDEQKTVYEKIITAVNENEGEFFFLCDFGGTGKTFIWNTLSTAIRSKGEIVLTVASSGIASLLLPGGRTTHSRFVITLNIIEDSTCNIKQGTPLANLIIKTKLIIWDEAPMMHRYCFEALDKSLRDILSFKDSSNSQRPSGGETVVFGGDFRKILPVIPKGTRQNIVNATLNCSYLWSHCQLLQLTKNMRLQGTEIDPDLDELRDFANWILAVGDGRIGSSVDGIEKVPIPKDLLINESIHPISSIVESTYPDFISRCNDVGYLQKRAILAPTLDMVESINQYMISLNQIPKKSYLSSDKICGSDQTYSALEHVHTPEFLNTIKCSGVPNHAITLKVGVPVMLLRNIDQSA
ncbi:ATP-dependent DNA helicase pif1 isoform X1 [Capsicum galapagoense]